MGERKVFEKCPKRAGDRFKVFCGPVDALVDEIRE